MFFDILLHCISVNEPMVTKSGGIDMFGRMSIGIKLYMIANNFDVG